MNNTDPIKAIVDQLAGHAEQITQLDTRQADHHAAINTQLTKLTGQTATITRVVKKHAAALTQLAATSQAAPDPDAYYPRPAPAWQKLADTKRAEPIARLQT